MESTTDSKPAPSDWKISELYEKSWEIVKKNKVLWILGMAIGAGSGSSGFNNLNFDSESLQKYFDKKEQASSLIPNVLGASTDQTHQFFSQLFSAVPAYLYLILGLLFVVFITIGIIVGFIFSAWANAALLQGIQSAINGKGVSIRDSSEKAFPSIKSLIWLSILTVAILIGGVIVLTIPIALVAAINNTALTAIMVVLAVFSVIPLILLFTMTGIWAPRLVVFEKRSAWESFRSGFRIAKKKFWTSLGLGIVNAILSGIVMAVPILILVGIFFLVFGSIFGGESMLNAATITTITVVSAFVLVAIVGITLLAGIITAFKSSVWTIAYNKIKGKYDK